MSNFGKENQPQRRGHALPSSPNTNNGDQEDIDQDTYPAPRPLSCANRRHTPTPIPEQLSAQLSRVSLSYTNTTEEYAVENQQTGRGSRGVIANSPSTPSPASDSTDITTAADTHSAHTAAARGVVANYAETIADIPQPLDLELIRENRQRVKNGMAPKAYQGAQRSGTGSQHLSPPSTRRRPARRLPGPLAHGAPGSIEIDRTANTRVLRSAPSTPRLVVTSPSDDGRESDREPP
ncbi:hypothetical protein F5Y04DRAFT_255449 [Hypomontagnella monticulosa]|nr:hypothetical protein F5Y04DRAFT_255449 [Hypomontagnella monticulosa]